MAALLEGEMMPSLITLANIPNQTLTVVEGGYSYVLKIKTGQSTFYPGQGGPFSYISFNRNGTDILSSVRVVPNAWIFQFEYLSLNSGNFRFESDDGSYPLYQGFGTKYNLYYYSQQEVDLIEEYGQ